MTDEIASNPTFQRLESQARLSEIVLYDDKNHNTKPLFPGIQVLEMACDFEGRQARLT